MDTKQQSQTRSWLRSPAFLVLCGFLIIAIFFLVTEHRAHALGVLPFILLLLCPILHFLMHGKHGGHGGGDGGHAGHNGGRKHDSGGDQ
ncbi:MAG: DUF2933 domain-containing protein [Thermodesulfobacteriota bacterium]